MYELPSRELREKLAVDIALEAERAIFRYSLPHVVPIGWLVRAGVRSDMSAAPEIQATQFVRTCVRHKQEHVVILSIVHNNVFEMPRTGNLEIILKTNVGATTITCANSGKTA